MAVLEYDSRSGHTPLALRHERNLDLFFIPPLEKTGTIANTPVPDVQRDWRNVILNHVLIKVITPNSMSNVAPQHKPDHQAGKLINIPLGVQPVVSTRAFSEILVHIAIYIRLEVVLNGFEHPFDDALPVGSVRRGVFNGQAKLRTEPIGVAAEKFRPVPQNNGGQVSTRPLIRRNFYPVLLAVGHLV